MSSMYLATNLRQRITLRQMADEYSVVSETKASSYCVEYLHVKRSGNSRGSHVNLNLSKQFSIGNPSGKFTIKSEYFLKRTFCSYDRAGRVTLDQYVDRCAKSPPLN